MSRVESDHEEHGSITSYVIGFILSLLFTFIPYYIVQNNKGGGNTLLIVILALAVVQLVIQIIYFLHLGRKAKRWEQYFFVGTVGLILVVVGGSVVIINNLHKNMSIPDQIKKLANEENIYQINGELTGACQSTRANHKIVITDGPASPRHTSADICDTITFVNQTNDGRSLTFGAHPAHDSYGGEDDIELRPGKNKTITLSETGAFIFHDHKKPSIGGTFSVIDESRPYK